MPASEFLSAKPDGTALTPGDEGHLDVSTRCIVTAGGTRRNDFRAADRASGASAIRPAIVERPDDGGPAGFADPPRLRSADQKVQAADHKLAAAKQDLLEANLRLVVSVAKNMSAADSPLLDLIRRATSVS